MENDISALRFEETREIQKILGDFTEFLRPYIPELLKGAAFLGETDFLMAKAQTALDFIAGMPVISSDGSLSLRKARHPLLEKGAQGRGARHGAAHRHPHHRQAPAADLRTQRRRQVGLPQDDRTAAVHVPVGHADPHLRDLRTPDIRPHRREHRRQPEHRERPQHLQLLPRRHARHARRRRRQDARAHRRVRLGHRTRRRRRDSRGHTQRDGQAGRLRSHHHPLHQPQALRLLAGRPRDQRGHALRRIQDRAPVQAGDRPAGQLLRLRARQEDEAPRADSQGRREPRRRRIRGHGAQPAQDSPQPPRPRRKAPESEAQRQDADRTHREIREGARGHTPAARVHHRRSPARGGGDSAQGRQPGGENHQGDPRGPGREGADQGRQAGAPELPRRTRAEEARRPEGQGGIPRPQAQPAPEAEEEKEATPRRSRSRSRSRSARRSESRTADSWARSPRSPAARSR